MKKYQYQHDSCLGHGGISVILTLCGRWKSIFCLHCIKKPAKIICHTKYFYNFGICICFRYIDNYISNLTSNALGVKFIISGDTAKVVSYKLELDKDECDGYCPNNSSILQNNEAEKYRERIEMKLMIHVLRAFDLIELKKNRLIK